MGTHTSRRAPHVCRHVRTHGPPHLHDPIGEGFITDDALPPPASSPARRRSWEQRGGGGTRAHSAPPPPPTCLPCPHLAGCAQTRILPPVTARPSRSAARLDPSPGQLDLLVGGTGLSEVQQRAVPLSQFQGRRATSPPCHLQGEGQGSVGSGTTWRSLQPSLPTPSPMPSVWWC